MKENKSLKIFFTLAILEMFIVAAILGYFAYGIVSTSGKLRKRTSVLEQKTELAQVANDLENQKAEVETEIKNVRKRFFNDQSLMVFLKKVDHIASAYGLSIEKISFGRLKTGDNPNQSVAILPVSISVKGGDYDSVVKFMSYLEKQKYSMKPNSVSLNYVSSRKASIKEQGTMADISFSVYLITFSKDVWSYGVKLP